MTIRKSFLACQMQLRRLFVNKRFIMVLCLLVLFPCLHHSDLIQLAHHLGVKITPWLFPHLFIIPAISWIYGFLIIYVFARLPVWDDFTPFLLMRTGRDPWILGQVLYVLAVSAIVTIVAYLGTVLSVLPELELSLEWGPLLHTLAEQPSLFFDVGLPVTSPVVINREILTYFTPLAATGWSCLLFFLLMSFMGCLILFCNLIYKTSGVLVATLLVAMSTFVAFGAQLMYGTRVLWFSPASWGNLLFLRWNRNGDPSIPSLTYAVSFYTASIVVLSVLACLRVRHQDMEARADGFGMG